MDEQNQNETPAERMARLTHQSILQMQQNQLQTSEAVNNLSLMVEELMRERNARNQREEQREAPRDTQHVRVDVETFDGVLDGEKYIEWEKSLERFFEFKEVPEEQQYKIAKVKLVKYAETWLGGEQSKRVASGKARISTWPKLKKKMRGRFVPTNYKQNLYVKWSTLRQGTMAMEDYIREFERLAIMCEIVENEELRMGRFMAGLDRDIYDKLEVYPNLSYDEACKMAIKLDHQKKRRRGVGSSSYDTKTPFKTPTKEASNKAPQPPPFSKTNKEKTVSKDVDLSDIVCFKCRGRGHYKKDCPNPRALTTFEKKVMVGQLLAYEEGESEEGEKESEEEVSEEDDCFPEKNNLVLRRALNAHIAVEEAPQR